MKDIVAMNKTDGGNAAFHNFNNDYVRCSRIHTFVPILQQYTDFVIGTHL